MKPSKFFLATVATLIGLTLQLMPLLLTTDSPKAVIGFPLPFLWEPNDVSMDYRLFEKDSGFSVAKLLFDSLLFIGLAFILEVKFRKNQ